MLRLAAFIVVVGLFMSLDAIAAPPEGGGAAPDPLADPPAGSADDRKDLEPDPDSDTPPPEQSEVLNENQLPIEGRADRPALPTLDRDLLAPGQGSAGRGSAQLTLAEIGEDLFLDLNVGYTFVEGKWRIRPRIPIRFRLVDHAPETSDVIRTEDWDEASDWARILQYVQYSGLGEPFFFRFGELHGATLGHGSLVNRYFNVIDIDHYQGGIYSQFDVGLVGGELVLDNVFDPEVMAVRAFVRPMSFAKDLPIMLRWLKLGVSIGADFAAPLVILETDGKLFSHPDRSPIVLADEVIGLWSVDLEVPLLSTPNLDIVPYIDVASVDGDGVGVHVGSYFNVRFNAESRITTRIEYRFLGEHYEPGYISPFYEIERYSFRDADPKAKTLLDGDIGKAHNGFYFETDLRIASFLRYTLVYATSGRKRSSDLIMRLRLPQLGPVSLALFYARLGFDGFDNMFAADQTQWGTSLRIVFADSFFIRGRLVNEWWLEQRVEGGARFRTSTNFDFGAGVLLRL